MRRLLARRERDERGVVAILVATLALLILMFAAYAVDIGMLVNKKHQLNDTLDAAAQAGAYELPGSSLNARAKALEFAAAHDPTETGTLAPNVDFWCVVASVKIAGLDQPDVTQIPATCNPGTAPYTAGLSYKTTGRLVACSVILCAIPCVEPTPNNATPKIACNTIRVFQGRDVPFAFAPAGGIMKGNTGNVVSVACKGSCGTVAPNPMDVAVVADRTGSMSGTDVDAMILGIEQMLQVMTPSQQYVALGTIARAQVGATPMSEPGGSCPSAPEPSNITRGAWIPIPFSDNYQNAAGTGLNNNSALVKGVGCLDQQSDIGTPLASPMKAAARYLLGNAPNNLSTLPARQDPVTKVVIFETDGQPNETPNSIGNTSIGDASDIFSNTDHYTAGPEVVTGPVASGPVKTTKTRKTGSGSSRKTWTDTYWTTYNTTNKTTTRYLDGGQTACQNFETVSTNAKAAGILVITIAYNLGGNNKCSDYNPGGTVGPPMPAPSSSNSDANPVITSVTPANAQVIVGGKPALKATYAGNATVNQTVARKTTATLWAQAPDDVVRNVLAAAASPVNGVPSLSNNDCATTPGKTAENSDGDYFFCAASGSDMGAIFTTALSQVSKGIRFIKMP